MKNIFSLLYLFDIPGYDIDAVNKFSLLSVVKTANEYALKIVLNDQQYILFTSDYLQCNRYSSEQIGMAGKLEFIRPKGVKEKDLVNADGEADYYVKTDMTIDFGGGAYYLARIVGD